ncbi:hypothetical protein QUA42_02690 [Microcoleus sp. Pol11C2]|uniref:hypothetical protein n=1 Tax=Microcoleus sp. Pol11C2 TaxID=3055389 RepID=UPI002FD1C428
MGRFAFLVKYTAVGQTGTGTDPYRTSCSCIERVANFLDIKGLVYTPSEGDLVDRAAYSRSVPKPDGTFADVAVAEGKRVYLANSRAGSKKVFLTTGLKTTKGTKRQLSITFPSFLSVAQIADALGELIPATKIATTGTVGVGEIEPFFSIEGGRTYPIMPKAAAVAAIATAVAITEAEQVTITTTTKSRKKRKATTTP